MGSTVHVGVGLGVALLVLVVAAVAVARWAALSSGRAAATASVRAAVQLAVVSVLIGAVVRWLWAAAVFGVLMLLVAAVTATGRVTGARRGVAVVLVPLTAGVLPVVVVVLVTGTVPLTGIAVVPVVGIVVGGAMTATSLAGRRALDELATRHGEYEAALALGFLPRDAALEVVRPVAGQALVPALDQTRTVGLVTLPGAFVGVLIGSGDPVQAGAAQLLVLVGLLTAETIAVAVTIELVARGALRTAPSVPARAGSTGPRRQQWLRRRLPTR